MMNETCAKLDPISVEFGSKNSSTNSVSAFKNDMLDAMFEKHLRSSNP
jgi:hypothetical protein